MAPPLVSLPFTLDISYPLLRFTVRPFLDLCAGMLIDPSVNQVTPTGAGYIKEEMITEFKKHWGEPGVTFAMLFEWSDPVLKFQFPNYFNRHICAHLEYDNSPHMVMGTNWNGDCVFWTWLENEATWLWECLNDVSSLISTRAHALAFADPSMRL